MKKNVNLFDNVGTNALYELIRTRKHSNDKQAIEYWNKLYNINSQYLDKKFASEFPNSTEACLWELTLSEFLRSSSNIELRWSRYLVIDFSHPWLKSTRRRAKLKGCDCPACGTLP